MSPSGDAVERWASPAYGWQRDALRAWQTAGRRGIIEAVTGTGKTRVGEEAIAEALSTGRRAMVLVPTKELQSQWYGGLNRVLPGCSIGRLGDGHHDSLRSHKVLVAIIDSARNARDLMPGGSLLVADECHRYASPVSRHALSSSAEWRLGLTATLERPDREEQHLISYFGQVAYRIGYAEALADGVVAQFAVCFIGIQMSLGESYEYERLSKTIGDLLTKLVRDHGLPSQPFYLFMRAVKEAAEGPWSYAQADARAFLGTVYERKRLLAMSPSKIGSAPNLAPAMAVAERTLVFTESIDAAEIIAEGLRDRGLRVGTVHSELKAPERREVFTRYRRGTLDVIVAPRVLDEGVDVPAADLAVIVSASKTRRQMIQRMGRVLRRKSDDRQARFAVLYLEETTEDPALGAHEAFLGEITTAADDVEQYSWADLDDSLAFLSILQPWEPSLPPRLEGDPPRWLPEQLTTDEDLDASAVLGVGPGPPPHAGIVTSSHNDR